MSESRGYASSTVIKDGLVWITGGQNENGPLDTTECINSTTMSSGVSLPEPTFGHVITKLNDTTSFLIGGYTTKPTNKTFYFNHETKKWMPGPDLNEPRFLHTPEIIKDSVTHMEHVVIAGGSKQLKYNDPDYYTNSVEILFNNETKWSKGNIDTFPSLES